MPDAADLFPEIPIEYKGTTYILTRPNWKTEGAYRAYLENEAKASLLSCRPQLGPEDFAMAVAQLAKFLALKSMGWGASDWAKSLDADENKAHLFWLTMNQKQKVSEVTAFELYRERKREVDAIMFGLMNPPQTPPEVAQPAESR